MNHKNHQWRSCKADEDITEACYYQQSLLNILFCHKMYADTFSLLKAIIKVKLKEEEMYYR